MKTNDITGQQFGKWRVIMQAWAHPKSRQMMWLCECEGCGKKKLVMSHPLRSGRSLSCGSANCRTRNARPASPKRRRAAKHPLYNTWSNMRRRCNSITNPCYWLYGGRGVKVCPRWSKSFWLFVRDMGERPEGHSLDRIDPNGNYCPENCRWADKQTQSLNRRPYSEWKTKRPRKDLFADSMKA